MPPPEHASAPCRGDALRHIADACGRYLATQRRGYPSLRATGSHIRPPHRCRRRHGRGHPRRIPAQLGHARQAGTPLAGSHRSVDGLRMDGWPRSHRPPHVPCAFRPHASQSAGFGCGRASPHPWPPRAFGDRRWRCLTRQRRGGEADALSRGRHPRWIGPSRRARESLGEPASLRLMQWTRATVRAGLRHVVHDVRSAQGSEDRPGGRILTPGCASQNRVQASSRRDIPWAAGRVQACASMVCDMSTLTLRWAPRGKGLRSTQAHSDGRALTARGSMLSRRSPSRRGETLTSFSAWSAE